MLQLQEKNNSPERSDMLQQGDFPCSGRSLFSVEDQQRNSQIEPWQGDEFYSRIKKSIQQTTRAKSAVTRSVKYKACENRAKNLYSKVNTVHIELTPFRGEIAKRSISKWTQPISNATIAKELTATKNPQKEKQYRFTTVSFVQPQPQIIHQRKLSAKCFQPKIKVEQLSMQQSRKKVVQSNAQFGEIDQRKSMMFFFEVRNHGVVNRERMVMKLRNIQKGRASRALNYCN